MFSISTLFIYIRVSSKEESMNFAILQVGYANARALGQNCGRGSDN